MQIQSGRFKGYWECSRVLVELLVHASHTKKMDGSGQLKRTTRRFLKPVKSFEDMLGSLPADEQHGIESLKGQQGPVEVK